MSSEPKAFGAATSIGQMTKLFVCYEAVTTLMERFCQVETRRDRTGWRRHRLVASAEPHGRARQEPLVGGQVGPVSCEP